MLDEARVRELIREAFEEREAAAVAKQAALDAETIRLAQEQYDWLRHPPVEAVS